MATASRIAPIFSVCVGEPTTSNVAAGFMRSTSDILNITHG